jgi:hypothetical protein
LALSSIGLIRIKSNEYSRRSIDPRPSHSLVRHCPGSHVKARP